MLPFHEADPLLIVERTRHPDADVPYICGSMREYFTDNRRPAIDDICYFAL